MVNSISRALVAVTAMSLALVAGASSASAASNDNFDSATSVGGLPFTDIAVTSGTTKEPGEPQTCAFMGQTVWYSFTPGSTGIIKFDNSGTGFATDLNVYRQTGSGFGGLSFLGCSQNPNPVIITAQAGQRSRLLAQPIVGNGRSVGPSRRSFDQGRSVNSDIPRRRGSATRSLSS